MNIRSRHGNLRAAQGYLVQAWQRINRAQRDNDDQLSGHGQRAKDFLMQANEELKSAAQTSSAEGR